MPRKIGAKQRPSVFYDPKFCEQVVEMGKAGMCREEIAVAIGCEHRSLWNWMRAHPEFKEAMKFAKECELAYFMRRSREALDMPNCGGQATMLKVQMNMRFPGRYRETVRNEHTGKNGGPIETIDKKTPEQIMASLSPAERTALAAADPKIAALFGIPQKQHTIN